MCCQADFFSLIFQNGADHSDKVEEAAEEKHENGDGMFKVTCVFVLS